MINRENWIDVTEYLNYQQNILQRASSTTKRKQAHLRHLLEWVDGTPLPNADHINPIYPQYLLLSARNDGKEIPLSITSMKRSCLEARSF